VQIDREIGLGNDSVDQGVRQALTNRSIRSSWEDSVQIEAIFQSFARAGIVSKWVREGDEDDGAIQSVRIQIDTDLEDGAWSFVFISVNASHDNDLRTTPTTDQDRNGDVEGRPVREINHVQSETMGTPESVALEIELGHQRVLKHCQAS